MGELVRDGVRLVFEEAGSGEPAMVFVHGWTCDRSHFAPQVALFSPGHRCISIDLRGHGQSDKPEQAYTIDGFADDVAWMCDQLGLREETLVGHSMGGAIVLAVAASRPDLAGAVVMCDPAILFPPEVNAAITALAATFDGPSGADALRNFGATQFFQSCSDASLKEEILAAMTRTPGYVVKSAFENLTAFDSAAALAAVKAPVLYIGAEPAISDLARLRELRPDAIIAKTAGSGHFHQLEVPEQVNAMIARFLAVSVHGGSSPAPAATTA